MYSSMHTIPESVAYLEFIFVYIREDIKGLLNEGEEKGNIL